MSNKIYKSKMKDENRLLGKIVNISLIASKRRSKNLQICLVTGSQKL